MNIRQLAGNSVPNRFSSPTLKPIISVIRSVNKVKLVSKLKPNESTFQWTWPHTKSPSELRDMAEMLKCGQAARIFSAESILENEFLLLLHMTHMQVKGEINQIWTSHDGFLGVKIEHPFGV